AAARNAFNERGHTARVQSPGGGGDPQGVLRGPSIVSASNIMIIAQISDTHIELGTADADQRIADFERTIAAINGLDPAPDVVVHTGDIVHNGRQDEYARAALILEKAQMPVYVLAGNKDNRENLRAAFSGRGYLAAESDFIDYAVEMFPVRLIA